MEENNDEKLLPSRNEVLQGDFYSRNLAMASMTRHMANWKIRRFCLQKYQGGLILGSKKGNSYVSTTISLMSPFVHMGIHHYCPGRKNVIYIKYPNAELDTPQELLIDFAEEDVLKVWYEALLSCRSMWQDMLSKETNRVGVSLSHFLSEQTLLHEIHRKYKNENGEAVATLFASDQLQISTDNIEEDMSGFAEAIDDPPSPTSASPSNVPQNSSPVPRSPPQVIVEESGGGSSRASVTIILEGLKFRPPKMNILFMVVGTRGDVQPVLELALTLLGHGHRIRFATHLAFKAYVEEWAGGANKGKEGGKMEFFPLGGDPHTLSEYMVKNGGSILPLSPETLKETPKLHGMLVDILNSCWDACIAPWGAGKEGLGNNTPFAPDAIISNPVTNAHIHCAEALGIPLILMFPQPWVPTKAYPHPLACMSYETGWHMENYLSYQVIDRLLWLSLERDVNEMRVKRMGLEELRVGDGGWNRVNSCQIPFLKMWSPSLLPKPKDWRGNIEVVGNFFPRLSAPKVNTHPKSASTPSTPTPSYTPPAGLLKFLELDECGEDREAGNNKNHKKKRIVVGFGSMVVAPPAAHLYLLFLKAASLLNIKILIQLGWTKLDEAGGQGSEGVFKRLAEEAERYGKGVLEADLVYPEEDEGEDWEEVDKEGGTSKLTLGTKEAAAAWVADQDAFLCPPCPHDWLLPFMDGVVHHGGAGTVHTSLKCGVPTWVIPFFGDQYMWGQRVGELGCGPPPVSLSSLTLDIVYDSLHKLVYDEGMRERCQRVGGAVGQEDALGGAVSFFYRHLPWHTMLCDASVQQALASSAHNKEDAETGEVQLAQVFCPVCRLKMSLPAYIHIHQPQCHSTSSNPLQHLEEGEHLPLPLVYRTYPLSPPLSTLDGVVRGMGGYIHETIGGVRDVWGGVGGGVAGVIGGVGGLLKRQVVGGGLLLGGVVDGLKGSAGGGGKGGGMSPSPDTPLSPPPQSKVWEIRTQRAWGRGDMLEGVQRGGRCVVTGWDGGIVEDGRRESSIDNKKGRTRGAGATGGGGMEEGGGKGGEMYRSFFRQREKMSLFDSIAPWGEEEVGGKGGGELVMSSIMEESVTRGWGGRSVLGSGGVLPSFPAPFLAGSIMPRSMPTVHAPPLPAPNRGLLNAFLKAKNAMRLFRKLGGDGVSPLPEERYVYMVFQALAREELLAPPSVSPNATPITSMDSPYTFPSLPSPSLTLTPSESPLELPAPIPPESLTVSAALHLLSKAEGITIRNDDEGNAAGGLEGEEGEAEGDGLSFLGFSILLHVSQCI